VSGAVEVSLLCCSISGNYEKCDLFW